MGGSLIEDAWPGFDDMVREFLPSLSVSIPGGGDVHDYFVDLPSKEFKNWKEITPDFQYDQKTPFFSMLVPTLDTVCKAAAPPSLLATAAARGVPEGWW